MRKYIRTYPLFVSVFILFVPYFTFAQAIIIEWDMSYGGTGNDYLKTMHLTTDDGTILAGSSNSGVGGNKSAVNYGQGDFWIVKTDIYGSKLWDKAYGGNDNDQANSIIQTADGGFLVGGSSKSTISGNKASASFGDNDYWILKLDSNGNKIWEKTYGGTGADNLERIIQTSDGGYLIGGASESGISGNKATLGKGLDDYWVLKLDSNGNKQWENTFGGSDRDWLYSVKEIPGSGYILGGHSKSTISGDKSQASRGIDDYWIIKVNANGTKIWDKTFGSDKYEILHSVELTTNGGYLLGGSSSGDVNGDKSQVSNGSDDFWVIKTDSLGNKLWDKTYGGNGQDNLFSIQKNSDGSFILGGASQSGISGLKSEPLRGSADYWIVVTDASGNKLWDKTVGGANYDILFTALQTPDAKFILAGSSNSGNSFDKLSQNFGPGMSNDFWVVKLVAGLTGIPVTAPGIDFTITPNPTRGKFQLQLNNLASQKVEIVVSDLTGRLTYQQQISVLNNQMKQEINLPEAKGMYLFQIKAGNIVTTRKIIVQ